MLKDYGYFGVYRDENITINVLLENPLEHDLSADMLVFSITMEPKRHGAGKPRLGVDITFYLMDESGHFYNTLVVPDPNTMTEAAPCNDGEQGYYSDGFICTEFKPELLFQDLRLVFFNKTNNSMKIIRLEH